MLLTHPSARSDLQKTRTLKKRVLGGVLKVALKPLWGPASRRADNFDPSVSRFGKAEPEL